MVDLKYIFLHSATEQIMFSLCTVRHNWSQTVCVYAVCNYVCFVDLCTQRLASLLILNQLVNQCTEGVVPFIVDRFLSAPHKKEQEDDLEMDKLRAQRRLPPFPVSPCKMLFFIFIFSLHCARLPWFLCICALGGGIKVGCICVTVLICLANKGHNAV